MFITELPKDKYGNRGYTNSQAQVIEVEKETVSIEGAGDWEQYRVIAPQSFLERWSTLSIHSGWIEVPGPARLLVEDDYVNLLLDANVKNEYIECAAHRL